MVDSLLPEVVLSPGDGHLAPKYCFCRQLLVLQSLVDDDVIAALPGGDHYGVLDELECAPGEADSGGGVETLKAAGDVDLRLADLLLSELGGHCGGVDHHPGLSHGLAVETGDLAGVGPRHGGGGSVEEEAAVLGVVTVACSEAEVHLILEEVADKLRLGVHFAGNPLTEGRGVLVEVPLHLQLVRLALVIVEVAVEEDVL